MTSNINPSLEPTKSLVNFRFWCQKVLPLVYDDSLSYYEVLGKMVVQLNDVIDNVNADTDNVLTLKDAFLELQTYVNNFFDDIDQLASYAERAEAAQTAANASAINASESASNASASSLAAMDARDAAVTAKEAAQASANSASEASTNAATKANEAAQSAITAQTAQASASQSATLAATDRSAAQTAASTATTKASEASQSATNAETSKDEAETLVNNVRENLDNIQQNTEDISDLKGSIADIDDVLPDYKYLETLITADSTGWENSYYYSGSIGNSINKTAYANTSCMYFGPVKEGDTFYVTARSIGSAQAIVITDDNDILIDKFESPNQNSYYDNAKYTVPQYGTKMYLNTVSAGYITSLKNYLLKKEIVQKNTLKSPLNGLKWASFGDSLVEHNATADTNWVSYIDDYTGAVNTDLGGSGSGFYRGSGDTPTNYISKINRIPSDVELITICPSFNDVYVNPWPELPIGTVDDTGTATVSGYINDFFNALLASYPTIPIIVMVTAPWETRNPNDAKSVEYISVIKQICIKNGIPFNDDNFYGCGLKPWLAENKTEYYTHPDGSIDGIHPNSKGHIFIYRTFRPFMEKSVLTLS